MKNKDYIRQTPKMTKDFVRRTPYVIHRGTIHHVIVIYDTQS